MVLVSSGERLHQLEQAIRYDSWSFLSNEQRLKSLYHEMKDLDAAKKIIEKTLIGMIDESLRRSFLSNAKHAVLLQLRAFVSTPNDNTWGQVCVAMYSNSGYEKGFFSKTRDLIIKIKYLYDEHIKLKEIPAREFYIEPSAPSMSLSSIFFNDFQKQTDRIIKELYAFVNGLKMWESLSVAAKNYKGNSQINLLLRHMNVRKSMPHVDKLCVDIGLYLEKHPGFGQKHNVMRALFHFINKSDFSLYDLKRVLIENPRYGDSYRQQSRVLQFKKKVMMYADEIMRRKTISVSVLTNDNASKITCLAHLVNLQNKYRETNKHDKLSVCTAFMQLIEGDTDKNAWSNMFKQQMAYPTWSHATLKSDLVRCYIELKEIYTQHDEYFNLCELLLENISHYESSKEVNSYILEHTKVIAELIRAQFFNDRVISDQLIQRVLIVVQDSSLRVDAQIKVLNILFPSAPDNSDMSQRNSIETFSDGSSIRDSLISRGSAKKDNGYIAYARFGGFR